MVENGVQKGAETLGYEFEALAIYDLMRYVKPPVSTLCVGNAFGEAAMLLAAGEKVAPSPCPPPPSSPFCFPLRTAKSAVHHYTLHFLVAGGLCR